MSAFTHFSRHGSQRVSQRLAISAEELAEMLDHGLFVNTGSKPGFRREHLVFWSLKNDEAFVAIRDALTGTVVTVLPLEYHDNLAWPISEEVQLEAKALAKKGVPKRVKIRRIYVGVTYTAEDGSPKTKNLHSEPGEPYNGNLDCFVSRGGLKNLKEMCEAKDISMDSVTAVLVRSGSKGIPRIIEV